CDLIWKLLRQCLPTGHRMQWLDGGLCPRGCDTLETPEHVFLLCPAARSAWQATVELWHERTGTRLPLSASLALSGHVSLSRLLRPLWTSMHAAAVSSIWAARCRAKHSADPFPTAAVWAADILFRFERHVRLFVC